MDASTGKTEFLYTFIYVYIYKHTSIISFQLKFYSDIVKGS